MAVAEVCSGEASSCSCSPKISFSHNFSGIVPVEQDHRPRQSLSSTIDFSFYYETQEPPSSAEELFSDGKIVPAGIKKPLPPPPPPHPPCDPLLDDQESCKNQKPGNGRFCNLHILSKSNSTGSTPNNCAKQYPLSKSQSQKQQSQVAPAKSSCHQKAAPSKNKKGSYGGGIEINPVLNVPIANLCGFGSLCFSGKDRTKKKR